MQGIHMYMVVVDEACYAKLVVVRFSPWFGRNTFPIQINDKKKPREKKATKIIALAEMGREKKKRKHFHQK